MRAAFAALLLLAAAKADAFLFGGGSDKKAAELLAGLRAAYAAGDCQAVTQRQEAFLREKPPAELREEAYSYVGSCYESTGLTDKAIGLYKLAIGLYPDNAVFAARLAAIYNRAGFSANAVPLFLKVLQLKSDDIEANLGLARAYSAQGFYSRAKEFYSRAVILQDFSDAAVLREYAACMLRKSDWDEALFIAGKGSALEPKAAYWPLLRARVQAGRGDYYKALPEMEAAIRQEPSRQLRLERALYLLMGGLPRRSIEAVEPELALDAKDPLASVIKAMALYRLGDAAGAEPYFKAALAGGPFTAKIAGSFLGLGRPAGGDTCKK